MLPVASVSLVLAYLLLIWLKTNAFVEYMTLLGFGRFLHIDEYNDAQKEGYGGTYVDFLFTYYHDKFLVRLLACPVCVSFWLGISMILFFGTLAAFLGAPLILFFYLLFHRML